MKKNVKKIISQYYMCKKEICAKDIYSIILESNIDAELWDIANIIEISTMEKNSIDIEKIENEFNDEEDKKFLSDNEVKTIFVVKFDEKDNSITKDIFKKIIEGLGGFLCSDTDDFMPIIMK